MKSLLLLILLSISSVQGNNISISDSWIKAIPASFNITAAYLKIKNNSNKNIKLIGAKTSSSKFCELHTHTEDNGIMSMRKVPYIIIPAGKIVELKPKSFHIMLIKLKNKIKEGDMIPIQLQFENHSPVDIKPIVKKSF